MSYESFINDTIDSVKADQEIFYFCKTAITSVEDVMIKIKEKLLELKDMPNFIEYASQEEKDYFISAYHKINNYFGE